MLNLKEIKKFYPEALHPFNRFILREYLQYKILEIIYESIYARNLIFMGGTCLRIVHNNTRFSEDLDFDKINLSKNDFIKIADLIKQRLELQGYAVEIKNIFAGAFHCYIRFPELLFNEKLSGHIEEKILIQLDTEAQHFNYKEETYILNKFDVFTALFTVPKDILLAQKFYALINRKRKKGRDFYDIVFLLKNTKPNYDYLKQKLNINNSTDLKERMFSEIDKINLKDMAKDVEKFLFNPADIKFILMFKEYINQVL
ncbi:MAG: nucleotidyl transferase AbiEii/AbiGii toxin family protein [Bacteroidales bacterium]|nr:nucleotidyl transferase AbiEii/AbiGii toxin family protein [Bacteroidales bacterium]